MRPKQRASPLRRVRHPVGRNQIPLAPAPPAAVAAAGGAGRLAGGGVPRFAGGAVRRVAVAARRLQRQDRPRDGFQNFQELIETPVYRTIVLRTVLIAALVTITDAILAFPIAFYMAKVATPRVRALLVVAVLMPLWSSYLVKVYTWRIMLVERRHRELAARADRAERAGLRERRHLARLLVPVAAVHDPADLRRARADPELADRRLGRPRRAQLDDVPARDPPAGAAGAGGRARSSPSR